MAKFRAIEGHPKYMVSDEGDVVSFKRTPPRILTPAKDKPGYHRVSMDGQTFLVHRIVAQAWVSGEGKTVNHIDGNKSNNAARNLEWCSQWENHLHAMRLGLHSNPERAVVGVELKTGNGIWIRSLRHSEEVGFNPKVISRVMRGDFTHHRGYAWFHADQVLGEAS